MTEISGLNAKTRQDGTKMFSFNLSISSLQNITTQSIIALGAIDVIREEGNILRAPRACAITL